MWRHLCEIMKFFCWKCNGMIDFFGEARNSLSHWAGIVNRNFSIGMRFFYLRYVLNMNKHSQGYNERYIIGGGYRRVYWCFSLLYGSMVWKIIYKSRHWKKIKCVRFITLLLKRIVVDCSHCYSPGKKKKKKAIEGN